MFVTTREISSRSTPFNEKGGAEAKEVVGRVEVGPRGAGGRPLRPALDGMILVSRRSCCHRPSAVCVIVSTTVTDVVFPFGAGGMLGGLGTG